MRNKTSGLKKALGVGLVAGLTALMPVKSDADPTTISYSNAIEQHDVNGNGFYVDANDVDDFYTVNLNVVNLSGTENLPPANSGDNCFRIDYDANIELRGGFNLRTYWGYWSAGVNSEGNTTFGPIDNVPLLPGDSDTFSYDVLAKDVLGWETTRVSMFSNNGANPFDATIPVPEPTTMGLLGIGLVSTLVGRRIKDSYRLR